MNKNPKKCLTPLIVLLLLTLTIIGYAAQHIEYIAHRGASYLAPENTMASVLLGWQLGADAVEVDIQLTHDNQIVVIHDKDTRRVSGVDLKVSQSSLDELQKLDVGRWKDQRYAGEKIPLLEDIIKTIPKGKRLYIEIKCGQELLPHLNQAISRCGKRDQITFISFDLETLAETKTQFPDIPAYWMVGTKKDKVTNQYIPHNLDLIEKVRQHKIDGLNVHYAGVNETFMKAIRQAGQALYVWTVDNPQTAQHLIQLGVKGITTNRPKWIIEQFHKKQN